MSERSAKEIIGQFLPSIMKIIDDDQSFGWIEINSKFNKIVKDRTKIQSENSTIEPTLFDVIFSAQHGNREPVLQLNLLENLFSEMATLLDTYGKQLIKDNLRNLLKSSDNKYMNFVGEIAALVNILKTSLYKLEAIEFQLPSGKSVDFKIKNISSEEISYVEVFSIHLNSDKVFSDQNEIEIFLTGRINKKILSKEFSEDLNYFIVPILWGKHKDLLIYSDFFQKSRFKINRVIEPLSFLTFIEMDGSILHRFGRISELFNCQNYKKNSDLNYLDGLH
jgi:hypothetical protein